MTIEKHFPVTLVQYSNINVSKSKPQKFDSFAKANNQTSKTIRNLVFNQDILVQNATSSSCTANYLDTSVVNKHSMEQIEILNQLIPPREYYDAIDKKVYYIQYASLTPATRKDVYALNERLNSNLQKHEARDIGLCIVRRKFFKECFDEIIRQVSIECVERGILLSRIKDEINQTIDTYKLLYTSACAFGLRKLLLSENSLKSMCLEVDKCRAEISSLSKKLNEERMLRIQVERQLLDQEISHGEKVKEINHANSLIIHDLKAQIMQLTSKSIQLMKT